MSEKLIIEGFAGIKKITLNLDRINVLIGPQATGKSICAKLLFYFKTFVRRDLFSAVDKLNTKRELNSLYEWRFENYFPSHTWGESPFSCRYEIQNEFIEIRRTQPGKDKIELNYSDFYMKEFTRRKAQYRKQLKKQSNDDASEPVRDSWDIYQNLLSNVRSELGEPADFEQIFIPAGRSFFANLQNIIFSVLSENAVVDPFLKEFGSYYERIRSNYSLLSRRASETGKDKNAAIETLLSEILCGTHESIKGIDYLIQPDGRWINIANASSGQQEVLPLARFLSKIYFLPFSRPGNTIYIEEPEAHLFPTAQRRIVELIALIFNMSKNPLQFIITTHSPYILTSFNNLIHAGCLSKSLDDKKRKALHKIVPEDRVLDSDWFSAYSLKNGRARKIKSGETGLIVADVLDSVSDDLAIEFDKLLDLE